MSKNVIAGLARSLDMRLQLGACAQISTRSVTICEAAFQESCLPPHGEWHSSTLQHVIQITNLTGTVVGRSKVLLDCTTSAHWLVKMGWDDLLPVKSSALSCRESTTGSVASCWEDDVLTQPLLITIYDYKGGGRHAVIAEVNTTIQDLVYKANQLAASHLPLKETCQKEPSYKLSNSKQDLAGYLYVKQIKSAIGQVDPLSQQHSHVQTFDLARMPNLPYVSTPPGRPASYKQHGDTSRDDTEMNSDTSSEACLCLYEDDDRQDGTTREFKMSARSQALIDTAEARIRQMQGDQPSQGANVRMETSDGYTEGRTKALMEQINAKQKRLDEIRARRDLCGTKKNIETDCCVNQGL